MVSDFGDERVGVLVYKILPESDWQEACRLGKYFGSEDDLRDGFIHLSAGHQVAGTAARHFRGMKNLILVAFAAGDLGDGLKWEPSRGGDLFPHLYGPLPTNAALWTKPLPLGADGVPVTPEEVNAC
ncbi:MAG: DUF952 domain-containing protein [Proteobacteria bacterium]|jgi:Uncharacterized protein conserved in bacteria|nr:MAG: DUF952 domain-containing protein [Pseudomonadota bacterium]